MIQSEHAKVEQRDREASHPQEAVTEAVYRAIYGDVWERFQDPEKWDHAEKVADAALHALTPPKASDSGLLEEAHAALRWIYENGLRHSTQRPEFVGKALDDAYAPIRAAKAGGGQE